MRQKYLMEKEFWFEFGQSPDKGTADLADGETMTLLSGLTKAQVDEISELHNASLERIWDRAEYHFDKMQEEIDSLLERAG